MTEKEFIEDCGQKLSWVCSYIIDVAKKQEQLGQKDQSDDLPYDNEVRQGLLKGQNNKSTFKFTRY